MKRTTLISIIILYGCMAFAQTVPTETYLKELKAEMCKKWPKNRTINIVFHSHSVPSGYWSRGEVHTLDSYPHLTLQAIKSEYQYAVVNVITTSIGGENSEQGCKRFARDVLGKSPDVVFIDYALNDRKMGPERAAAWEEMVQQALINRIKVILMTPTPDIRKNILDNNSLLANHAERIKALVTQYDIGLIDSFEAFRTLARNGEDLSQYMTQNNHPNGKGYRIVADLINEYFMAK